MGTCNQWDGAPVCGSALWAVVYCTDIRRHHAAREEAGPRQSLLKALAKRVLVGSAIGGLPAPYLYTRWHGQAHYRYHAVTSL